MKPRRPCGDGCNRSTCAPTVCHGRIPWDELPCREFCNHYAGGGCFAGAGGGKCGNPYTRDDPRYWLGRGSEDVPGRSFGWAWNMEDAAIRAHLVRRGHDPKSLAFHSLVTKLHMRLQRDYHRRKPPVGVRRRAAPTQPPVLDFTAEELAMIAERFAGANDPVGQSIHAKALALG